MSDVVYCQTFNIYYNVALWSALNNAMFSFDGVTWAAGAPSM